MKTNDTKKKPLSPAEVEKQARKLGIPMKEYMVHLQLERQLTQTAYVSIPVEAYQRERALEKAIQAYNKNPKVHQKEIFADEIKLHDETDEEENQDCLPLFQVSKDQSGTEINEEAEQITPPSLVIPKAQANKKGEAGSASVNRTGDQP